MPPSTCQTPKRRRLARSSASRYSWHRSRSGTADTRSRRPAERIGLAVLHQRQVDVDVRDHLGNRTAVAIGGLDLEPDLAADREPLLQVAAGLLAEGLWAISGASMQASRTVTARPDWRTRRVSPSPMESTVALTPTTSRALLAIAGVCTDSLFMQPLHGCRASCGMAPTWSPARHAHGS